MRAKSAALAARATDAHRLQNCEMTMFAACCALLVRPVLSVPAGTGTGMEHRREDGIACCTTPKRAHVGRARFTTDAHLQQI